MYTVSPKLEAKIRAIGLVEAEVLRAVPAEHLYPIGQITPNDYNPKKCTDDRLLSVTESLKRFGWLESDLPMIWQPNLKRKAFTVVNGEHRFVIALAAGFKQFPAVLSSAIKTKEDAIAMTLTLEEARARPDATKRTAAIMALAQAGRDEELQKILRIVNPERIREIAESNRARATEIRAHVAAATTAPRLVPLTMTQAQFAAWQAALGKARGRLGQAQATVDMVRDLSDSEVVAVAAALKGALGDASR